MGRTTGGREAHRGRAGWFPVGLAALRLDPPYGYGTFPFAWNYLISAPFRPRNPTKRIRFSASDSSGRRYFRVRGRIDCQVPGAESIVSDASLSSDLIHGSNEVDFSVASRTGAFTHSHGTGTITFVGEAEYQSDH